MSLPTAPDPNNLTLVYQVALFVGVVGTLLINAATFIKSLAEKKQRETEAEEAKAKEKIDEATAASTSVTTALNLLPPLKARIKDLEEQVATLETEVESLEKEVEGLEREKRSLTSKVRRLERIVTASEKERRATDKANSKASLDRKEIIDEQTRVREEKKEDDQKKE